MKHLAKWALILTALLPLVVGTYVLFPYVFPKVLVFRGIVFLCIGIVSFLVVSDSVFRANTKERLRKFWARPGGKTLVGLGCATGISTIFAFDRTMAFWGTVERGEGFIGFLFLIAYIGLLLIFFTKKEWIRFFVLSLGTGCILFIVEMSQIGKGINRPGSLVDNPIFLATYFLFCLFAALVVYRQGKIHKHIFLQWGAIVSACISCVGILFTGSRGVLVGSIVGVGVALWHSDTTIGRRRVWRSVSVRSLVVGITMLGVVLLGSFIATRHELFWKRIPGFSHIVRLSFSDPTFQSRRILAGSALAAVNPDAFGIGRLMFGWGPDNFIYAWEHTYNPRIYQYDPSMFDRAHNRLLDVVTMTGIVGIFLYLSVWFFLFREIVKKTKESAFLGFSMLFFATAFFVQNLTSFNVLVTFVCWGVFLAYVFFQEDNHREQTSRSSSGLSLVCVCLIVTVVLVYGWMFFFCTVVPYRQMQKYQHAVSGKTDKGRLLSDRSIFYPDSVAQGAIREQFLRAETDAYDAGTRETLFLVTALARQEEYLEKHPYQVSWLLLSGKAYRMLGIIGKNDTLLSMAKERYVRVLALMPERQSARYAYAIALMSAGEETASVQLLRETVALNPGLLDAEYRLAQGLMNLRNPQYTEALENFERALSGAKDVQPKYTIWAYQEMMDYFYSRNDSKRFRTVIQRLAEIDRSQEGIYRSIDAYIDSRGTIPSLRLSR